MVEWRGYGGFFIVEHQFIQLLLVTLLYGICFSNLVTEYYGKVASIPSVSSS